MSFTSLFRNTIVEIAESLVGPIIPFCNSSQLIVNSS
jgi:hypothetical protein